MEQPSLKLKQPEYATAKIAVWWDMYDCPIPKGYDAGRIRQSMEGAFKKRGYFGPVSIYAYGDQKHTSYRVLGGLSSAGIDVLHTASGCRWSRMFSDILKWRGQNPPPAIMMLISNHIYDVFSWDLSRLQQRTLYKLFVAYSCKSVFLTPLVISAEWFWEPLLHSADETTSQEDKGRAMFNCKSCSIEFRSLEKFRKHLSGRKHAVEELIHPGYKQLDNETKTWGSNYPAEPEYATAKIAVWWDMHDCPTPDGYDATRVRPSLEGAFKSLGYSGPVSIYVYGDLNQTPDHLLQDLSSTGVVISHTIPEVAYKAIHLDMRRWQCDNPPPATTMFITDHLQPFSVCLARRQQLRKYNFFQAYSFRPFQMSILLTSAEWLWNSLLEVSETTRQVLRKCSERESGNSTVNFYCKVCDCECKGLDNIRKHLSSSEHAREEGGIHSTIQSNRRHTELWQEGEHFPKRIRWSKAFPMGFRLLHNHLRGSRRRDYNTGGDDHPSDNYDEEDKKDDNSGVDNSDDHNVDATSAKLPEKRHEGYKKRKLQKRHEEYKKRKLQKKRAAEEN